MRLVLDTNFFVLHYFSRGETLAKTKAVLNRCRKLGNSGVVPAIVLGEFYAVTAKKAGRGVAEKAFLEVTASGLTIADVTASIARQAGVIRAKYMEKVPWGDCIIASTSILCNADYVVTEDPYFKRIGEIKAKALHEIRL
jgi:predicted nucleic acid-binding protein